MYTHEHIYIYIMGAPLSRASNQNDETKVNQPPARLPFYCHGKKKTPPPTRSFKHAENVENAKQI